MLMRMEEKIDTQTKILETQSDILAEHTKTLAEHTESLKKIHEKCGFSFEVCHCQVLENSQ